jgi:hypothetical protein
MIAIILFVSAAAAKVSGELIVASRRPMSAPSGLLGLYDLSADLNRMENVLVTFDAVSVVLAALGVAFVCRAIVLRWRPA